MTAEIKANKNGVTFYYRNGKLTKKVDYFDKRAFDWIMPQLPEYFDGK